MALAFGAQHAALASLMRRTQTGRLSPADWLTYSRAVSGGVLAGLVLSGARDRRGPAGWLGWLVAAWGIAIDTFDGALAKRCGLTRAGPTLDIESDSWLTLWASVAAARWGKLPAWTVLPPLVRYAHPLLDLWRRNLPVGGGPWWGRLTGGSQTGLQLTALAPFLGPWRDEFVRRACVPISGGQLLTMLMLFRVKRC